MIILDYYYYTSRSTRNFYEAKELNIVYFIIISNFCVYKKFCMYFWLAKMKSPV